MYRCIVTVILTIVTLMQAFAHDTYRYKRYGEYKDDSQTRWAIDAHIGGTSIISAHHTGGNVPLYRDLGTSQMGLLTSLHVEYYIPGTKYSVKAGYEHEEINYLKGDLSYDLNQLMVGGRWRMAPTDWWVQPYVGADVLWALDAERGNVEMDATSAAERYSYQATGVGNMPRFSVGPVVVADIYLFSHIALQLEYSFRVGLNSHCHLDYTDNRATTPAAYHGQIHRHALSAGLKIDFPFSFTEGDERGLLRGLLDSY